MKNKYKLTSLLNIIISLSVVLILTFGRSIMGVYIFDFRLGELVVGFLILFWIFNFVIFKTNLKLLKTKKRQFFYT